MNSVPFPSDTPPTEPNEQHHEQPHPPPHPPRPPRMPPPPPAPPSAGLGLGLSPSAIWGLAIVALVVFFPLWIWFFWRIEPNADEIAVLIHKTGRNLPSGQILAMSPNEKGIQLEVLAEGRHFRNPYSWGWIQGKITDIPAGKLAVLTRLFGDDLPPGTLIATDKSKGILKDVLRPGKYRINPYAYDVEVANAIAIRPGYVGVVIARTGSDVMNAKMQAQDKNTFLVGGELKGVLPQVLDPGTHYLNPYMFKVVEVNLQSQRFALSGEDAITFLTSDGFDIMVEGTLEYALMREKVALLTHQVGDMDEILKKIILPEARAFSRLEGSKYPAKNFITGETRQVFQDNLDTHLKNLCLPWGLAIKSVLIRNITPPDQIASIIREREVAIQTSRTYEQQMEQAKSKAELTRQETLALQSKAKVEADTTRFQALILAKQEQAVRLVSANKDLGVAKIENEASMAQSAAMLLTANGEKEVIRMNNEAQASVLASQVAAFSNGVNLARHEFYERIGPRVQTILSNDKEGLGDLFTPFAPAPGKGVAQ